MLRLLSLFFISLSCFGQAAWAACQVTTPEVSKMHEQFIELINQDGESILLKVKVADDIAEQAAGFQHICADQFDSMAILFVFNLPKPPTFHMNNVYANLDIAFIDETGLIGDVQLMKSHIGMPGQLYPSKVFTKYALEVEQGFFDSHNIVAEKSYLKIK